MPGWSRQDLDFFLHGSMSTEFVPEQVLRAFIQIYPDLFPKQDLSNLGLIPDATFGWPIGFSRRRARSCKRFVVSQETIASWSAWLPSMTMRSGRP